MLPIEGQVTLWLGLPVGTQARKVKKGSAEQVRGEGKSFVDKTYDQNNALFETLSEPLKKLHAVYLSDVAKNCYPEKWMSMDMPNEP